MSRELPFSNKMLRLGLTLAGGLGLLEGAAIMGSQRQNPVPLDIIADKYSGDQTFITDGNFFVDITLHPQTEMGAVQIPNTNDIVYIYTGNSKALELKRRTIFSQKEQTLTTFNDSDYPQLWVEDLQADPSGQYVSYILSSGDNLGRIMRSSLTDGTMEQITPDGLTVYRHIWSPDGQTIVFSGWMSGEARLYTLNPKSGGLQILASGGEQIAEQTFSPDGTKVAFTWIEEHTSDIYVVDLQDFTLQKFKLEADQLMFAPRWESDRSISFSFVDRTTYAEKQITRSIADLMPVINPDG